MTDTPIPPEALEASKDEQFQQYARRMEADMNDLGAEINRLKARIRELEGALEVFACDCEGKAICLGNCMHRNARAALEGRT